MGNGNNDKPKQGGKKNKQGVKNPIKDAAKALRPKGPTQEIPEGERIIGIPTGKGRTGNGKAKPVKGGGRGPC